MKSNILTTVTIALFISCSVRGQGFIIPEGTVTPPLLTHHDVNVDIKNQVAQCRVEHVFKNNNSVAIEGVFYFPIPRDASVSDFAMWVDGKKLKGEVLNRDAAKKIYEDIVRRNIDPALLEYADHQFFRIHMFPIPAKRERTIELHYSQVLVMNDDLIRFLYPLHGETQLGRIARAMPTEDASLPQRRRIKEADQNENFDICIDSETSIANIYSPSHDLEIVNRTDHHAEIHYEARRQPNEKDFLLYYSLSQDELGATLMCHRQNGDQGYFMLLISPPVETSDSRTVAQDLIFVLDTSGSMEGEKLQQAKSALTYCINGMRDADRFALITYSSAAKKCNERFQQGEKAKAEAVEFIRNISAVGGTNIQAALMQALSFQKNPHRNTRIVFITDGLPTVGETDVNKIVGYVAGQKGKFRLFSFGVGYDVNTYLLDKIAEASHGASDYIAPDEDIEQNISLFFEKVKNPVLTDVKLAVKNVRIEEIYPAELPDLCAGSQLTIVGRYRTDGPALITLRGQANQEQKSFEYEKEFKRKADNNFLPHLWASRKVAFLLDEIRTHGENDEMRTQVEKLCQEYGILSPYTSYLVQEDQADKGRGRDPILTTRQDHIMPSSPQQAIPTGAMDAEKSVGESAVVASRELRKLKEAEVMEEKDNMGIRIIEGVTFYDQSGRWQDSRYRNDRTIEIKKGSAAYVNLLMVYPELGKFMVLDDVIVKFHEKFIHVGKDGQENLTEQQIRKLME